MPNFDPVKLYPVARKLVSLVKRETVLAIAVSAAFLSMLVVPPSAGYAGYIDFKVLSCLFCLMAVVAGLRKTGLFDIAAAALTRFSGTVRGLSVLLITSTFFISMAVTNDVALITFVPFTLILLKNITEQRSRITIITLQTIAANIGSSLTPVGNPQNLYLFSYYQLTFVSFLRIISPLVAIGGLLLLAACLTVKNEKLSVRSGTVNYSPDIRQIALYVLLFALSVLSVFRILDYRLVLAIVIIGVFIADKTLFARIDYSLLITFIGFFVFIGNIQRIDSLCRILTSLVNRNVVLVSALTSQIISNVPAAILLSRFTNDAQSLLRGVSIGGMGTIIASLASVISYKFFVHDRPESGLAFLRIFSFWNILFLGALYTASLFV